MLVIFTSSRILTSNIFCINFTQKPETSTMSYDSEFSFIEKNVEEGTCEVTMYVMRMTIITKAFRQIGPFWKLVSYWNEKKLWKYENPDKQLPKILLMLLVVVGESRFRYFVGHKEQFFLILTKKRGMKNFFCA